MSIPLLIDADGGAVSPPERLFVDLLHSALVRAFTADDPLAPNAFVVNFSVGVRNMRFANQISALARLIDWWSWKEGVLFVISAGNIDDVIVLENTTSADFEDAGDEDRCTAVRRALASQVFNRTLLAPAEALNALTVGAVSVDAEPTNPPASAGIVRLETDEESLPQLTSAVGLGPSNAIKPDLLTMGGASEVRASPNGENVIVNVLGFSQRTGLMTAEPRGGLRRSRGTSDAAALTTRAVLEAAASLVEEDGPYQGLELPRRDLALLTRALAVNAAIWPESSNNYYSDALSRFGDRAYAASKMDVARHFGHGVLEPVRMAGSPENGATLVGLGDIRKDQGKVFDLFLPPSLSGERLPRALRVTLAWFSPVDPTRAVYRLAKLSAIAAAAGEADKDDSWGLKLKGDGPDANMVARGTVWSRRLVTNAKAAPAFGDNAVLPIRVQCQETMKDALSPDDDVRFAIVVSLEIEAEARFDVLQEIREAIAVRLRDGR